MTRTMIEFLGFHFCVVKWLELSRTDPQVRGQDRPEDPKGYAIDRLDATADICENHFLNGKAALSEPLSNRPPTR